MHNTGKVRRNGLSRAAGKCVFALMVGCGQQPAPAMPSASDPSSEASSAAPVNAGPEGASTSQKPMASKTPEGSEDGSQVEDPELDPSFTNSRTRPQYDACVKRSGGETWALQQCGDEELSWQDARLNRLYQQAIAQLARGDREQLRVAQRAWLKQTDEVCKWDASTEGQGQMLDAQSCRLNRTVNRADELENIVRDGK